MMAYGKMSYWDCYSLPIPMRKWLIQRYNKHAKQEQSKNQKDSDTPLSSAERIKMIQDAQQASYPAGFHGFMNTQRNKK